MIWSTCWISRGILLHSETPMISSTSQRLPRKICGLFDSGFAGDAEVITSLGLNAPIAVDDYDADALSSLQPVDYQQGQDFFPKSLSGKQQQQPAVNKADTNADSWFDDLDPDMSGDPLGDDSMEAFINLDKFLNGNSFFDEDGNLTVPDEKVKEQEEEEAEVAPVINFTQPTADIPTTNFNFVSKLQEQDFLLPVQHTKTVEKKASRKRTAGSSGGVKTSLYEIPAISVISDIIHDGAAAETDSYVVTSDTELVDHDYTSKRQRMSDRVWNDNEPSTSGIMGNDVGLSQKVIPKSVMADDNNVQMVDETLDKQSIRRIKNNYASKRSREQRKQKFSEMDKEAEDLVFKNQKLREKIVELEKLAKEMKAVLVAKMSGK